MIQFVIEPLVTDLEAPQALLQRLLEGPAYRHRLADGLHGYAEDILCLGEFLESEPRYLDHAVVNGGFERSRRLLGYIIAYLVKRVTYGKFSGYLGYGKTGRLRGQGGAPGDARVHLYDDHPAVRRVDRELYVGAAGLDADLPYDGDGRVPHPLVLDVGKRLHWRDGDGVPCMYAHGVEVLYGTDYHHVVLPVAHDLQLELLPPEHGLLYKHFAYHAVLEAHVGYLFELFRRRRYPAAGAAKREAWPYYDGKAYLFEGLPGLFHIVSQRALGEVHADLEHGLLEVFPVLGLFNGVVISPEHLDVVLFQYTGLYGLHRGIKARLPAERRQQRVGPFLLDDLPEYFRGDRFYIGDVGCIGIGHYRGGV